MILILTLLSLGLSSISSHAYIPEYGLITSRAADQHGKGGYLIEQEVTYRKENEVIAVKETWLIANENKMRVTLEGRGALKGLVQGTFVFDGGQRFFVDGSSPTVRAQRLGEDWLEPLFYFRTAKSLRSRLVALKVAPPESLRDRPALSTEGSLNYEAPGFVRLSRVGGAIAWAIGVPAATGQRPALWIEQDQFVIRKFRGHDQVLMKADDYAKYEEGLWFPHLRNYKFGAYSVDVQTLQVKSLGKLKPEDSRFQADSLNPTKDALKLPETDALKEFYSRFR